MITQDPAHKLGRFSRIFHETVKLGGRSPKHEFYLNITQLPIFNV